MTDTHALLYLDGNQMVEIGTGTYDECHQLSLFHSAQPPFKPRMYRIVPIQAEKPRRRWWPWRKS